MINDTLGNMLPAAEVERSFGLSKGIIRTYIRRGKFIPGEVHKGGRDWFISAGAIERVFPVKYHECIKD